MKVWRDKQGNKLTAKEFSARFKEGVASLTPEQKLTNEVRSTFTMLIGYVVGLVSLIIYRDAFAVQWFTYGLIIIFLGASWSNAIKWIALKQQLKLIRELDTASLNIDSLFNNMEKEGKE
jgi:hypothetical protein